jgi:replicative DNA helicase
MTAAIAVATAPVVGQIAPQVYRQPPANVLAEQMLLGAVLINNEHLNRVDDFLRAEHFYEPVHQRIYDAVHVFQERGVHATPVTLKHYFDKDAALEGVGGADYLARLASMATTTINVLDYGRTVYDLALRRQLIGVGEQVVNDAYDKEIEATATQQIEQAEQSLFTLASEGNNGVGFRPLKQSLTEAIQKAELAYRHKERVTGVASGFSDLDHLLGGLQNSDLLILAGRPSMGKTALAINIAINAALSLTARAAEKKIAETEEQVPVPSVGFFSLEMSSEQLAARILSVMSGVNSAGMRTGFLDENDFAKIVEANRALQNLSFFIDDTPALSISALRTRARRLKRRYNLSLLIVDYLQLVRSVSRASEGNRVQEVSEITQGLKAIAKELNIPVIALSQLSRAVEQREDKRPQLSDLRESGSIEQDADIVMFIYRDEYYVGRKRPEEGSEAFYEWQSTMDRVRNTAEVIIAKQRNGPIGQVVLHYDSHTTKFGNHAGDNGPIHYTS